MCVLFWYLVFLFTAFGHFGLYFFHCRYPLSAWLLRALAWVILVLLKLWEPCVRWGRCVPSVDGRAWRWWSMRWLVPFRPSSMCLLSVWYSGSYSPSWGSTSLLESKLSPLLFFRFFLTWTSSNSLIESHFNYIWTVIKRRIYILLKVNVAFVLHVPCLVCVCNFYELTSGHVKHIVNVGADRAVVKIVTYLSISYYFG